VSGLLRSCLICWKIWKVDWLKLKKIAEIQANRLKKEKICKPRIAWLVEKSFLKKIVFFLYSKEKR